MKITQLITAGITGLTLMIAGCTKEPINQLSAEESRIFTSSYDSTIHFGDYKTFSIADSVTVIDNSGNAKTLTATDAAYIEAVKKYMIQRGYVQVANDQTPDIGLNINRIYQTATGLVDYNDYYGNYGGYFDPYYWGYSGYGYYVPYNYGIYQITEGLVSIDMFDLKNAATKGKINLMWNGLARGTGIFNSSNADAGVQTLFSQSPYLTTVQ